MKTFRSLIFAGLALAFVISPALAQTFQSLGSASLSVTTTTGRVALPATTFGNNITILNVGSNEAFVNFGGSSVTAATTNESVPGGSGRCFAQQGFTNVAAITAASTTTLRISQGTGPCALSYRGGGGGTAADITIGTTTITGGTTTRVLFDNAGVLGEYAISGTGSVAMTASPTFTGQVFTAAGSGSAPGYSFASVPTSGLYYAGAGGSPGTATLAITNAGSVGYFFGGTQMLLSNARGISFELALSGTADLSISRTAAGILGIGTGANGSIAGGLQAATLALGGATIGTNALAVTGTALFNGRVSAGSGAVGGITLGAGSAAVPSLSLNDATSGFYSIAGGTVSWSKAGVTALLLSANTGVTAFPTAVRLSNIAVLGWAAGSPDAGAEDTILRRGGAANLVLGFDATATAAVAQTLSVQGSSGNSVAAALFTIAGSDQSGTTTTGGGLKLRGGNGTSAGGTVEIWTSATTTPAVAISVAANKNTTFSGLPITPGYAIASLPAGVTGARAHVTDQITACAAIGVAPTAGGALVCPVFYNGSAWVGG